MILAQAAKVLPIHWQAQYGIRPVLLETFVEKPRFLGTCYRAANWIYLSQTQGRGKLGPAGKQSVPFKRKEGTLPNFLELLEWKERKRRKPHILQGARQVGKTYSLKEFGRKHFETVALIDLDQVCRLAPLPRQRHSRY